MGHVRLPIVGLGPEHDQPMRVGKWLVGFVGEILNFRTFHPEAECDAELVAETWAEHGPEGFHRFDGFWSVVAIDSETEECHILVDYLAQKPIYYRWDGHALGAASEPDAVAAMGPVTPDDVYFAAVMKWGYCPETWRTPFKEVRKTLPGEHVILSPNFPDPQRRIADPLTPMSSTPQVLRAIIEYAVRNRVVSSDVPVACLLSGGLDSSIVYSLARSWGKVKPYFIDLGGGDSIDTVLEITGEAEVTCIGSQLPDTSQSARWMQEPIDLGSLGPQVALSNAICGAGGERVCLTGDGADEFFSGYGRAQRYDSQGSDVWHELVAWHLPRLDRIMMKNMIEVRSPFLSRLVCKMALGLPWPLRKNKMILRTLFRDILPARVVDGPKVPLRADGSDTEAARSQRIEMFKQRWW